MGKQFGAGITVKPMLSMDQLGKLTAALEKKYDRRRLVYSSPGHTQTNIMVGDQATKEELFVEVKAALKQLGYDVVERKEKNKPFLFIKQEKG